MKPSPSLEKRLRFAETRLKAHLSVPRDRHQAWHMSLGYFRADIAPQDKKAGAVRIAEIAREVLSDVLSKDRPSLAFLPPAVCVYADHTRYPPLFP